MSDLNERGPSVPTVASTEVLEGLLEKLDVEKDNVNGPKSEERDNAFSKLLKTGNPSVWAKMFFPGYLQNPDEEQAVMDKLEVAYKDPNRREEVIAALRESGLFTHSAWVVGEYDWFDDLYRKYGNQE